MSACPRGRLPPPPHSSQKHAGFAGSVQWTQGFQKRYSDGVTGPPEETGAGFRKRLPKRVEVCDDDKLESAIQEAVASANHHVSLHPDGTHTW
jgi:hypothetical protein